MPKVIKQMPMAMKQPDAPAPGRRRKAPATLLESVHMHAIERADYKASNKEYHSHHKHHRVTDDMIARKITELNVEDAREMAFQAKEQMRTLAEVTRRVKDTMGKAQDLDIDELKKTSTTDGKPDDMKRWVMDSRRQIKGAIFRYNESCEERNNELEGFCDWFEMYENIWPLPLVASEIQYSAIQNQGPEDEDGDDEGEGTDESFQAVHMLWPQIEQQGQDLCKIMNVTAEMGQKALNAEIRDQLVSLNNELLAKEMRIEELEDNLKSEIDNGKAKEQEAIKARQMHEVQIKRKEDDIQCLRVEIKNIREANRSAIAEVKEMHGNELASIRAKMDEQRRGFEQDMLSLKQSLKELRKSLANAEDEIEEWKQKHDAKEAERVLLEVELDRQSKELVIVRIQMNQVAAELAAERESPYVSKLETCVDELKSNVALLELKLEAAEEDVKAKAIQIRDLTGEVQRLTREVVELKSDIEMRVQREVQLQAKIKELLNELEAANRRIEQLLGEVAKMDDVIKQKDRTIEFKDKQMVDINQTFEMERVKHQRDRQELRNEVEQWRRRLDETVQELVDEQKKVDALKEDLKVAQAKVDEANRRKKEVEDRIAAVQEEMQNELSEWQSKVKMAYAELGAMRKQFQEDQAHLEELMLKEREILEAAIAQVSARAKELQTFKDEVESHVFVDLQVQTDDKLFELASMDKGGGAREELGGVFGSEKMRKKFELLQDRVLDVRGDFEIQMKLFKQDLLIAVSARSQWQHDLDGESAGLAEKVAAVQEDVLAKKSELRDKGYGQQAEDVLNLCRSAKRVVELSGAMKASGFEGDQGHAVSVMDHIPVVLYEVERIIEGINACFDPLSTPPASAPSSRPNSAKIKHLCPLLARVSTTCADVEVADMSNDFSKLNGLKPLGEAVNKKTLQKGLNPSKTEWTSERSQPRTDTMTTTVSGGGFRQHEQFIRSPGVGGTPPIPDWKSRTDPGPRFGFAPPEEEASWSYGPKSQRSNLAPFSPGGVSVDSRSGAFLGVSGPNIFGQGRVPFTPQHQPPRSDTVLSEAPTPGGRSHSPSTSISHQEPKSAQEELLYQSLQYQSKSLYGRARRENITERVTGNEWRKLVESSPPEIPYTIGTQWAASSAGALLGLLRTEKSQVGLQSPPSGCYSRLQSPDSLDVQRKALSSIASTVQRCDSPQSISPLNRRSVSNRVERPTGPSGLAERLLADVNRMEGSGRQASPTRMRPFTSKAALPGQDGSSSEGRSVTHEVLVGSRDGLRPGKVLRGGHVDLSLLKSNPPKRDETPYELIQPGNF